MQRVERAGEDEPARNGDGPGGIGPAARRHQFPRAAEQLPPRLGGLDDVSPDHLAGPQRQVGDGVRGAASGRDLPQEQPRGHPFLVTPRPRTLLEHELRHPRRPAGLHRRDGPVLAAPRPRGPQARGHGRSHRPLPGLGRRDARGLLEPHGPLPRGDGQAPGRAGRTVRLLGSAEQAVDGRTGVGHHALEHHLARAGRGDEPADRLGPAAARHHREPGSGVGEGRDEPLGFGGWRMAHASHWKRGRPRAGAVA